jgi:CelD/BcsL family acetyltransferase involved in cellulose biosynthesis
MSSVQSAANLIVSEITRMDQLPALVSEWSNLWAACPTASVFQSPDWLLPWWSRNAPGALWITTVRTDGGELVAVCPMFIHPEPAGRKLMLLGTGISDHLDALVAPRFERTAGTAILRHIVDHADWWDSCDLQELGEDAVMLNAHADCAGNRRQQDVCPALHLPHNHESLAAIVPARHRQNVQYYRRRVERQASVTYELATERTFETLFNALIDLHGSRWSTRGQSGVLADELLQQFHREAAWLPLRRGVLRLHALRLDGRIVACFYGFHHRGITSYYLGGFDPQFSRLNVGTLIVARAIDQAIEEQATTFDFLRGREPYKYAWGAVDRVNYQRVLFPVARAAEASG